MGYPPAQGNPNGDTVTQPGVDPRSGLPREYHRQPVFILKGLRNRGYARSLRPEPKHFRVFRGKNGVSNSAPWKLSFTLSGTRSYSEDSHLPPLLSASPTSPPRHAHRPALDKLGVDPHLTGIFLSVADVIGPARDPVHHELVVPADVRDRRLVAVGIRRHVDADQRNIVRHPQPPVEQELGRGEVFRRAEDENRRGRGLGKQGFEASVKSIVSALPARHVVVARLDTVDRQFIEKGNTVSLPWYFYQPRRISLFVCLFL